EDRIRSFKARDYWEIHATFVAAQGEYSGRWFDEAFQKGKEDGEARPERLWNEKQADAIREKCLGKYGVATEEAKPVSQLSPLLSSPRCNRRDICLNLKGSSTIWSSSAFSRFFSQQPSISLRRASPASRARLSRPRVE